MSIRRLALSGLAIGLVGASVAFAGGAPALTVWAPFPDGTVVDAAERDGALAALLLDGGALRFVAEPSFAVDSVATGVGDGIAPELEWDRRWTARYCRGGVERVATRGKRGWSEGPGRLNPACAPFERLDGVITEAAAGLPEGTLVTVLTTVAPVTDARVRTRAGVEATVPLSALATATGIQLRADLDGDDQLDTVATFTGAWPSDEAEGFTTRSSRLGVVAGGGGVAGGVVAGGVVRLSAPYVTLCGATTHTRLRVADATDDGHPDVLAVVREDVCEAGWLGDHLEVYDAALRRLSDTVAPAWPLVGPVRAGRVVWWPGGVRVTAVSGEAAGALVRSRAEHAWVDQELVARRSSSGPVTVRLGREQEPLTALVAGGPAVTPTGEHALEAVQFLDRELAVDALGASGQPPRVVRSLDPR
jgi:hypothetical protein